ncbi:MAG: CO dehydrogenase nickel-insertion accessory protein CooC1 [Thermodesulfobacterium sp.]|uniref:CO dehydrogenase nickel-insertion accessory protein CooC1 n=1 Tax=Candidatus Thermodesulfobacterium syntrophicum TaxID=3060442 RepID=A0AAE3P481_9BACT|nr:CO dehydrogenase nickel-insertion accessory protein CooC1 [Candidatus Thermodesulfobacterium syntrophicum]
MTIRFSLVGKGGTGKTTLSALLIDFLIQKNKVPILAVDADPNFNFNELLGLKINTTLSEVRESLLKGEGPNFMSRYEYTEMKVNEILVENRYFDLLVMGYPEKSGCYCPIHNFLSTALEKLMRAYSYVVIDNEAGMEHLSRLNLTETEHLIIVSDASIRGISTAGRIVNLVKNLKITSKNIWLVVNLCPKSKKEELKKYVNEVIKGKEIKFLGFLPQDPTILKYELEKKPVFEWESPLKTEAFKLFEKLFN